MEWERGHIGRCLTDIAYLFVGWENTGGYSARITNSLGKQLAKARDFSTPDDARDWCEATYKELLQAELDRLV